MSVLGWLLSYVTIAKLAAKSMKQPFQSGYLMDIPQGFERLEIAQSGHFNKPTRGQFSARNGLSTRVRCGAQLCCTATDGFRIEIINQVIPSR
jgi:hypothetical protein